MCYAQQFSFVAKYFILQKLNQGIKIMKVIQYIEFFPDIIFHMRFFDHLKKKYPKISKQIEQSETRP